MSIKKAVIPAAGLGTRMLPATKTVPKEMLPLVEKPAIQYIVEEAVEAGVEDILIITGRSKAVLEDHFDYVPDLEERLIRSGKTEEAESLRKIADLANIAFIRQKETKGLGHAVWTARRFVGNEPFAVLLGDDVMQAEVPVTKQLADAAEKYGGSAVGVKEVPERLISYYCSLDVKRIDERVFDVKKLVEKPSPDEVLSLYAILGRYVLSPEIFSILDTLPAGYGGEIQLTDALDILCRRSRMVAVDFDGRRFDTGNIVGFLEAELELSLQNPKTSAWLREYIISKAREFSGEALK